VKSPEEIKAIAQGIYDGVPFLNWLGVKVREASPERVMASFEAREDLIGNPHPYILHGGVISTVMDSVGGLVGILKYLDSVKTQGDQDAYDQAVERVNMMATIDMRSDFLSPGRGKEFFCEGTVLRLGRHVVVSRMECRNEEGTLIAVGTGSYNY
jgi:acyl-coenzyme A thioesterase PaaI-like protein